MLDFFCFHGRDLPSVHLKSFEVLVPVNMKITVFDLDTVHFGRCARISENMLPSLCRVDEPVVTIFCPEGEGSTFI